MHGQQNVKVSYQFNVFGTGETFQFQRLFH